jgi:catechol 2,3-dioxygenase-like lactoylglutathione lyase family enzyme
MIRHIAGIAEIVNDIDATVQFYREKLELEVEHTPGSGYATVVVPGVPHFGIWLRSAAAKATFGDESHTDRIALGFTLGFEVDTLENSEKELRSRSVEVLQGVKTEPWGQKTARFLSSSGALCEISETPWARQISQDLQLSADA